MKENQFACNECGYDQNGKGPYQITTPTQEKSTIAETLKKDIKEWQKKADNTTYDTQFDDTPEFEERQNLIQEARTLLLRCSLDL